MGDYEGIDYLISSSITRVAPVFILVLVFYFFICKYYNYLDFSIA